MDSPNSRSSHTVVTPRSGGVSIVLTCFLGLIAIFFFGDNSHINNSYMISFALSSLSISIISFLDDLKRREALVKMFVMCCATIGVMAGGVVIDTLSLPFFGKISLGWIGYPITFLWILGLTNAVNFMDGLDGLVGGVAVIVCLFFMGITYSQGSVFVYITSYTILAGTLGFLFLNMPPAKIFMGDVGSTFLGFVFATLAIIASLYDNSHTSFLVMPLLVFNIIFDTLLTFFRRLLNKENVLAPHRTHLYQLCNRLGLSHLEISLMQYCFCFLQGLGALWLVSIPGDKRLFVFLPFLIFYLLYATLVLTKAKKRNLI
ncbi:MAG: undecaprenyl/decaprenyl-phosphate alpha-N-acetylglucosaminyl 1-phosphate transferase [Bacteroidetes bacterium]|nr:undecaprenyl/decaprenyl-phosphate alpha-N-acetylglucosaminyl 1-phosphate transferase [Bacteroidota bacterium]